MKVLYDYGRLFKELFCGKPAQIRFGFKMRRTHKLDNTSFVIINSLNAGTSSMTLILTELILYRDSETTGMFIQDEIQP